MNTVKFNIEAVVLLNEINVITIDLGTIDSMEQARESCYEHAKTVDIYDNAKILYNVLEIENYGKEQEDAGLFTSIEYECIDGVDLFDTLKPCPTKDYCKQVSNYLPDYKIRVQEGLPNGEYNYKEISHSEIDDLIDKSFYIGAVQIKDEQKIIYIDTLTEYDMTHQ